MDKPKKLTDEARESMREALIADSFAYAGK